MSKSNVSIVIDANIARSCGSENSTFPTSKNCRDFLNSVYKNNYNQVVSDEIIVEWRKHSSSYSKIWQVRMYSKRLVIKIENIDIQGFEDKIKKYADPPESVNAMLKDCLLVKAAIKTDKIVASCDEKSRKPFSTTSKFVHELKKIIWVNPDKTEEDVLIWLDNGAKIENKRMLENYKK